MKIVFEDKPVEKKDIFTPGNLVKDKELDIIVIVSSTINYRNTKSFYGMVVKSDNESEVYEHCELDKIDFEQYTGKFTMTNEE